MSIGVVLVNYRTGRWLESLLPRLWEDSAVREIIVVDNSADDPTDAKTFRHHPIRYVPLSHNAGFAAAVNAGLRLASHRYVAIMNPDVRPHGSCLSRLYETAQAHGCALVGPRFYWDPEHIFRLPPATGSCLWWDWALRIAETEPLDAETLQWFWIMRHDRFWSATTPFPEPFLSGALMLVDRWAFSHGTPEVFDERFFLYFEDSDLSLQALQAGHPPLCDPLAEAVHYWNQSPEPHTSKAALMGAAHRAFYGKYYDASTPEEALEKRIGKVFGQNLSSRQPSIGAKGKAPLSPPFSGSLCRTPVPLGPFTAPPTFAAAEASTGSGALVLEFALTPLFIPFAQAPFVGKAFTLPLSIWNTLAPGTYFCRLRAPQCGTLQVWQWTKG